jgi:protein phosphatase 2C family protein 2/3
VISTLISDVAFVWIGLLSHAALFDRLQKSVDKGVVIKADGEASSDELGETISEEKNRHGMPDIHVDYYGPRGHNPRHH